MEINCHLQSLDHFGRYWKYSSLLRSCPACVHSSYIVHTYKTNRAYMLTYRKSLNACTVLHYCKLTSLFPNGEILLTVKPAELILLMLSDLSISLCVQKQSVEAAFPSSPPKYTQWTRKPLLAYKSMHMRRYAGSRKERTADCPEYRCYEYARLIF